MTLIWTGKPYGYQYTDGMVGFKIKGIAIGETITVELTFPTALTADAKVQKTGTNGFYAFTGFQQTGDNTITMTLTDGGSGDDDGAADGVITNVVGIATPGTGNDGKAGKCFIATAAYGSYLHPKVKVLREFRDKYLITNPWGKALVNVYYQYSPPIADYIRGHKILMATVRGALTPVVYAIEYPAVFIATFLVLLLLSMRRRKRLDSRVHLTY